MNKHKTALIYLLKALLPYSRQNLLLTYKPHQFFQELEKESKYSQAALKSALWRAKRSGLITDETIPRLTAKGRQKVQPFVAKKIGNNAKLLIIFDIPESRAFARRYFRSLLRNLDFKQVQLSVWVTEYNHRDVVLEAIKELELEGNVQFFEAARLFPK